MPIVATSPIIDAEDREISFAVAAITIFGTAALLLFPLIALFVDMPDRVSGFWAGLSMNDTSQVVAAGAAFSDEVLEVATVVKLVRNAFMATELPQTAAPTPMRVAGRGGIPASRLATATLRNATVIVSATTPTAGPPTSTTSPMTAIRTGPSVGGASLDSPVAAAATRTASASPGMVRRLHALPEVKAGMRVSLDARMRQASRRLASPQFATDGSGSTRNHAIVCLRSVAGALRGGHEPARLHVATGLQRHGKHELL